jgi:hypothetical protein
MGRRACAVAVAKVFGINLVQQRGYGKLSLTVTSVSDSHVAAQHSQWLAF